ncbi:MAG: CRISPR-associated CARF protein Csa3 [Sulfolobales archaeon]
MRSFIFTLGFHEDHVIRRLHIHNALPEDFIVLFTVSPISPSVRRAFEGVRSYTLRTGLREPKLVEVPMNSPDGIFTVVNSLRDVPRPLVVDVSGGMRFLGLFILISLLFMAEDVDIYLQPEGGEVQEIYIPKELFEFMRRPLSNNELEILNVVSEHPGITIEELARSIGKSEKTVRNSIVRLRKLLVVQKGRYAGLYPTKWVKVVTNLRPKHEEELIQTP